MSKAKIVKAKICNAHRSKTMLFNALAVLITVATTVSGNKEFVESVFGSKYSAMIMLIAVCVVNLGLRFVTTTPLEGMTAAHEEAVEQSEKQVAAVDTAKEAVVVAQTAVDEAVVKVADAEAQVSVTALNETKA